MLNLRIILMSCAFFLCIVGGAHSKIKNKTICTKLELENNSCHFRAFNYQLTVSGQSIRINDSIRHGLADFPMEEFSSWESMELKRIKNRVLLEMKIWSKPKSEANVESLHWVLLGLKGSKAKKHLNQIVRKRRINLDAASQYIYDPMTKHKLTSQKNSKLKWVAGRHSGQF